MTSILFNTDSVILTNEDKKSLDEYKYQGGDNGITYKYFHSPLAEMLAQRLPLSVAPNLITVGGALCLVLPHLLTLIIYGRAFEGPVSFEISLAVIITHFCWIILDNMDGKQARRTGTSSPLGQMFDHGCDTLTFSLCVMTVCRYRQIEPGYIPFIFISLAPTAYFMFNLKEYYLGEYYLPVVNAISEGSILELSFGVFCAYQGWEELSKPSCFGLKIGVLYAILLCVFQIYQNFEVLFEIIRGKKYEIHYSKSKFAIQFSSFFIILLLVVLLTIVSPNQYIYDRVECGRAYGYIIMFASSFLVMHLLIGHLAKRDFKPFSYLPFRV